MFSSEKLSSSQFPMKSLTVNTWPASVLSSARVGAIWGQPPCAGNSMFPGDDRNGITVFREVACAHLLVALHDLWALKMMRRVKGMRFVVICLLPLWGLADVQGTPRVEVKLLNWSRMGVVRVIEESQLQSPFLLCSLGWTTSVLYVSVSKAVSSKTARK